MATRLFTDLPGDAAGIAEAVRARMSELLPGVEAESDTLEGALVEGVADEWAIGVEILSDVLDTVLNQIGLLSGLAQDTAQPASGLVTVVSDGRQPYSLPAGSRLQAVAADQTLVEFATTLDVDIPVGSPVGTPVSVSGVAVHATEPGVFGNGLVGDVIPDQAYIWLDSITLDGPTGGGTDGEDDDEFLDKTAREMRLNSSQVIVPEDAADRVLSNPQVGGVTVLDLTDPSQPGVEVPNAVTIAVRDVVGEPLSTGVKTSIAADLATRRETNFGLFVVDYSYTEIDIAVEVAAYPSLIEFAEAQVVAAITYWLSPLQWSQRPDEVPEEWWVATRHVRRGEVLTVADACSTIAYVNPSSILINGAAADLALTGLAPLTRPGDINVTVVERIP